MPSTPITWVALLLLVGSAGPDESLAQTAPQAPHEHRFEGEHHVGAHSGPGYHRSFDQAERWSKEFDNPSRDEWQRPEEVLDALNLGPAAWVADVGAGTGYFSARIARRIPEGKLFAVDIEPDMVRYLGERANREHLGVLVPVLASATSSNVPEQVDLVLVVDTYHHIDDRIAYFAKLRASLRPGGRLAIVDFKADSPNGPPLEHRISAEQVTSELSSAGYSLLATHSFLPRQYFLVFGLKGP
jgi:SAM-dependent methyltransferase